MKKTLKKLVLFTLKRLAKKRLKKFKGKIIAVTGSVGKTSTKDAIYAVLNSQFKVKYSQKSMNSDFGLLLTILDIDSGFSSATKWTWYLMKGLVHSFMTDHSEVLLLELGVDAPGDMDFLLSVISPDIVIMTNIFSVHLDEGQFSSLEEIFEEKRKLVDALKEDGTAILNIDNHFLENLIKSRSKKNVISFGKNKEASYWASRINSSIDGTNFILHNKENRYEVSSPVLGKYQIYVLLPAIICGIELGMEIENTLSALSRFNLPPGRMSIIPAINDATILDSSYNSSPSALKEALEILKEAGADKRKVAVLGNMNELGSEEEKLHKMIGEIIPKYTDLLITVGNLAELFAEKAIEKGLEEKFVFKFKTAKDAAEFFKKEIKKDDVILVKGSQNRVRLERFVKEIMAFPEDSKKLLVRQEKVWQAKL
ncbi:MAG TPA: UDP-N-acetylmuramoyl-tripeptide--D-alanyl-D-alanine ligase [Flavobacteriales bacterium]|nr:UDP-N-acetylmuramoyl-tripeptide--D-alanyl-D-alanine ligase [Flavobacteriales bacterium]